jgi:ATP-dependent DNA helicase RecG
MPNLDIPLKKVLATKSTHLELLASVGVKTVEDLIYYFPRSYTDASGITPISDAKEAEAQTFSGILSNFFSKKLPGGRQFTKALLTDDSGSIELVWFNQKFITHMYKTGMHVFVTGKPKLNMRKLSLAGPTIEHKREEQLHTGRIVPIYHETEGLNSKWIREKIRPVLNEFLKYVEEYLPEEIMKKEKLMPLREAIEYIHFPVHVEDLDEAKKRLSFDELFLLQLKAIHKKWLWQHSDASKIKKNLIDKSYLEEMLGKLPFKLTGAQQKTLTEIIDDLEKDIPMARLVQGDVGSGKTVIAGLAALTMIKNKHQVAIMAPTEILAKQHFKTLFKFFQQYGINIQQILGSTPGKQKEDIIKQLKTGTCDLVIGTHALIQESIGFKKLGLAIIDEQHRFGVKQRDTLKSHGVPHLLSLSATPIPRTLAMTLYGDQDLSVIDELPPGRKPIETHIVPEKKRKDAYNWIRQQVQQGRQVFVVCPLIDESDELEVRSVMQTYEELSQHIFPELKVHYLHGKLKQEEKDDIMAHFSANEINVLVSTSVIEVGIDVPNATIMIIEGAERFGLSQLHQFRGRVGRGEHQSFCFLFPNKESATSTKRLAAMVQHQSGFALAEIDLSMRGPGELYGVRQSGIPDLKMASLTDAHTISKARHYATLLIEQDPELSSHPKLKHRLDQLEQVYVND